MNVRSVELKDVELKNIELINASAGSGKTHSLTGRVMDELRRGVAPESLAITTFTNRAAANLRERIRHQLLTEGMPDEAQRIFDGFVGTVNGICAGLLREYALDAGLSAALDVLPEEDGTRLFGVAVSRVTEEHADRMEGAALRLERSEWMRDVRSVVDLARMNLIGPEQLSICAANSWRSMESLFGESDWKPDRDFDFDKKLDDAVADAIAKLEKIESPKKGTADALATLKNFRIRRERAERGAPEVPWSDWLRLMKLDVRKDAEGVLDGVCSVAGSVLAHPRFRDDVRRMIEGVFACAAEALALYDEFKRKQGLMDFEDQEIRVLELARSNAAFRDSMRNRLSRTMVDEFQDTSPIQLSLFLALHALTTRSTWVGDPKQAIYGFRGTDPQLMDEATALIDNPRILDCSWRSKELLVRFCNAIYSRVFRKMGEERVRLRIPPERTETAAGGELELWQLDAKNAPSEAAALAAGIREFLRLRKNDVAPENVAVLCRTNDQCRALAEQLEALSVRASVPQGILLAAPECRLAIAALRYMQGGDSLAEAEIARLSPLHRDHSTWLTSVLSSARQENERDEEGQNEGDPTLAALLRARESLKYQTPLEALKAAIDAANLPRVVKSWSNPRKRMANLDRLCGVCVQYMDQCRARRSAATIAGFVGYLREGESEEAESFGPQTVQVLTWHRAKGLEWPVVILASLDDSRDARPFGVHIVPAPRFDPQQPLAGRSIRFWPWPVGQQKKFSELDARLASTEEDRAAKAREGAELRRLLYVGMTRARDHMIFAARRTVTNAGASLKTSWLDALSDDPDAPLIVWPTQEGHQEVAVAGETFPIMVREFSPPEPSEPADDREEEPRFLPPLVDAKAWPPARIVPSALEPAPEELDSSVVVEVADFGARIPIRGRPDFGALGSALHAFFAVDADRFPLESQQERRTKIMRRLLNRWGVEGAVTPSDVLRAAESLRSLLASRYPGARAFREWPITCRNEKYQRMRGWIDLLLELPDGSGYVIVDHKTTPGVAREHAKNYAPQLFAYGEAVERATGKKVLATLLHMPVCGLVLEVRKDQTAER
ncbi:MAG: UvrD-helicase domain-containing protein [Synergistaceae bacterium]|jgi:ATP-dependent exoDNAse (exonuclease V) beta subunit|nr:UvrD-helicase domain-containing protein [Synergistaceae bacterium]